MKLIGMMFGVWLFASNAHAQQVHGTDYVLTIDGVDYQLALDEGRKVKLKTGEDVSVLLKKQAFGKFSVGELSFEFPGTLSVASTKVDDDITQHIVISGSGTMMLVQHYTDGVPATLLDLMFDKMVEEPKALGLKIERTPLSRSISNGERLEGTRAHYRGGDDNVTIDIAIKQTAKGGYMVMTMHDDDTSPDEKPMIERFWQSLKLQP
jgi:hypothetical protein